MKIKKTLLSTEIEFTPIELLDLRRVGLPREMYVGLLIWIKKNFDLNMLSIPEKNG